MSVMSGKRIVQVIAAAALLASAASGAAKGRDGIRYQAIPDGAHAIVAEVRAKPGKERALREATLPLVVLVRSDPKNLVYFFQEDREAPGRFIFYEVFATRADFEAHNAMPYVQQWFGQLPELAEGGVMVRRLEILGHHAS
jgi:quinol monooxygenase YgiN